jgi:putative FmdB family regulatory protein
MSASHHLRIPEERSVPTYQYTCTDCGHGFEAVQSFSDDALTECPVCEGRLRKVFNSVGIVFKGSGFYRTDSREKSTASSPASSESKPDGSAKTDSSSGSGEKAAASTPSTGAGSSPSSTAGSAA